MNNSIDIVKNFGKARVAVLGDFCLDVLFHGKHTKFSRESAAPVNKIYKQICYPGAAANLTYNLVTLGVKNLIPISVIGEEGNGITLVDYGKLLLKFFEDNKIDCSSIIRTKERVTTAYLKFMATGEGTSTPEQQFYRADVGRGDKINKEIEDLIIDNLRKNKDRFDILVVSDYLKGVVTPRILDEISKYAPAKTVIGTTRENALRLKNFSLIGLNAYETVSTYEDVKEDEAIPEEKIVKCGMKLLSDTGSQNLILTRGENGMTIFSDGKVIDVPTKPKPLVDITGAGDTALAAIVASLGAGADIVTAAKIGNYAAGIVVQKLGTATTTQAEIIKEIENDN